VGGRGGGGCELITRLLEKKFNQTLEYMTVYLVVYN